MTLWLLRVRALCGGVLWRCGLISRPTAFRWDLDAILWHKPQARRDAGRLFAVLLLAALPLAGCWPTGPTVVVDASQSVTIGAPAASPSPAGPSCPAPASVELLVRGGCQDGVAVGAVCSLLSLTPLLGPGAPSSAACDRSRVVEWLPSAACAVVVGDSVFTPDVRGVAAGTCTVFARVDSVQSNSVTVTVR